MSMKNPMTPAGIEPTTFRFVAQHSTLTIVLPRVHLVGFYDTNISQCAVLRMSNVTVSYDPGNKGSVIQQTPRVPRKVGTEP